MLYQLGKLSDDQIPDIVCYEKQETLGGLWNVTWRTGLDEHGEQSHPSMYNDLWINLPKEVFEYPDYTYEEHFGKLLPSYAPRPVVRDYIEGRFTRGSKRDLKQFVKFATVVRRAEYHQDTDDFTVITKNLKENVEDSQRFTHVVVSSGMFTIPNTPSIPGIDDFRGRVLHSKDVKHVSEFKGQRLLIIGAALSGEDLALLSQKFGVEHIIISWKDKPLGHNWHRGIEERQLVEKFQGNTAYFKDGTTAEVDVVLLCTGYRLEFPFLSDELRLKSKMLFHPENLYNGILWMNGGNDKLMYNGLQYTIFNFTLFEAQAVWSCGNIMGTLKLPPREEMRAEIEEWGQKVKDATRNRDYYDIVGFNFQYFKHMVETVGYTKDVLEARELLEQWWEHRKDDTNTWKDKQFKCIYTGKLAPAPKIPWKDNFDDSLETFLGQHS